jgi:hypothetical protein
LGVPVGDVWESDVGVSLASGGRRSFVKSVFVGVSTSGQGGHDGVSAKSSVIGGNISGERNVNKVTRGDQSAVGIRTWVEVDGIRAGISEVIGDGVSARERFVGVFVPLLSTWNVIGVDVVSDVSSAN